MLEISNPKWSIYGCNRFQNGPNILAMSKMVHSHETIIFERISREQIFDDCKHVWSLLNEIASKLGSHFYFNCKHILSLFEPWLQAYVVQPYTGS